MQDPDLAAAFGTMQGSIEELAQTVGYASYAEIKSTQAITVDISSKADEIDANIKKFREELGDDVRVLYESHLDQSLKIRAEIADGFHTTNDNIDETKALIKEQSERLHALILKTSQVEKSRPDHQDKDKRKQAAKGSGKGDPGDKKYRALRDIKNFFEANHELFTLWRDAHKENAAQNQDMEEIYVEHTAEWLSSDPNFQEWTEGKNPLLWMKGPDGIGKSFLAHASLQKLPTRDDGNNTFAYFYFKEDFPHLQSVQNALACTALQIAEKDGVYAEKVAAKIKEDGDKAADVTTWNRFFLSVFGESAKAPGATHPNNHLYLIFDGLDEVREEQKDIFMAFLRDVKKSKSRVHVAVTSRPEEAKIAELEPLIIEITKGKMLRDMRSLIWNRLTTLSRLKKFNLTSKKIIRKKVSKQADGESLLFNLPQPNPHSCLGMLYVEHMLKRLSYIGREGAVLKDLENMPSTLHDLYKLMLDECRRNRSEEQYEALKRLFAWLAWSKRSLSLAEASELVKLTVKDDDFDIEDELIGRSARYVRKAKLAAVAY
jgi:hypothetical protein